MSWLPWVCPPGCRLPALPLLRLGCCSSWLPWVLAWKGFGPSSGFRLLACGGGRVRRPVTKTSGASPVPSWPHVAQPLPSFRLRCPPATPARGCSGSRSCGGGGQGARSPRTSWQPALLQQWPTQRSSFQPSPSPRSARWAGWRGRRSGGVQWLLWAANGGACIERGGRRELPPRRAHHLCACLWKREAGWHGLARLAREEPVREFPGVWGANRLRKDPMPRMKLHG